MGQKVSEETKEQEANSLRQLLTDAGVSNQAAWCREKKIVGGKALLNQHLKQNRPISLKSGQKYASALGCSLREISPRLAELVGETAGPSNVSKLPKPFDARIAAVVRLMEETDDSGRDKALAAVDYTLHQHATANKPNHVKLSGSRTGSRKQ